jgi:hypothetical protein
MTVRVKSGLASLWTSVNPVLANAQMGYESDTGRVKVGDGATAWNTLPYRFDGSAGLIIENRTSDPGSPVTGQIWLRTDL